MEVQEEIKGKVYISGPITGTDDYMQKFTIVARNLATMDYEVINPALILSFLPNSTTYEEYMSVCYPLIDMCDAVYLMHGWHDSKGARLEKKYAETRDKLIYDGEKI